MSGCRVQSVGCKVWGAGCGVQGVGQRGLGYHVLGAWNLRVPQDREVVWKENSEHRLRLERGGGWKRRREREEKIEIERERET